MTNKQIATKLWKAEKQAKALLGELGDIAMHYDSARTVAALGYVSQAAQELRQAVMIARIIARRPGR